MLRGILCIQDLHKKLQSDYFAPFSVSDVRRTLDALCELKRAILKDRTKEVYIIQFYNLAARAFRDSPGEQDGITQRAKFKEYGRIFARLLAKKEIEVSIPRRRIRFRGAKQLRDYPMLPFGE